MSTGEAGFWEYDLTLAFAGRNIISTKKDINKVHAWDDRAESVGAAKQLLVLAISYEYAACFFFIGTDPFTKKVTNETGVSWCTT